MSGHQVNFFLAPDDLAECERRIRGIAPLVFFEYRSATPKPKTLSDSVVAEMGKTWLSLGISRPEDLGDIRFNSVETQNYFTVDLMRSPVVELSRCFFDGKQLRRGRLYYTSAFYDENNILIQKSSNFIKWAKLVLVTAINNLSRDNLLQSYIGIQAEELRSTGKCTFTT